MRFRHISTMLPRSVAFFQGLTTNWPWAPTVRGRVGRLVCRNAGPGFPPNRLSSSASRTHIHAYIAEKVGPA